MPRTESSAAQALPAGSNPQIAKRSTIERVFENLDRILAGLDDDLHPSQMFHILCSGDDFRVATMEARNVAAEFPPEACKGETSRLKV
jgi:hypothetical protein